ncbi:MAG: NrdH-redoxin [Candidatus Cloacimonadota bacterium]|nr:MAG: NrdH-redoxin [Candidatus Cloacimonadota bacterium]
MASKKRHSVVVFTTPTCSWCRRIKQYLREHKIAFKEIDISKNQQAARDIVRKTGQTGVPVILINNRPIVGFNKSLIDRLLDLKSVNEHR